MCMQIDIYMCMNTYLYIYICIYIYVYMIMYVYVITCIFGLWYMDLDACRCCTRITSPKGRKSKTPCYLSICFECTGPDG